MPHSTEASRNATAPDDPGPAPVRIENARGMRADLLNLGATLAALRIPTPAGPVNAVLSYPNLQDYLADPFCLGSTVGRFANRIADARFTLDGREYVLEPSPGQSGHCLHGGPGGFSRRSWSIEPTGDPGCARFTLTSHDGDQGFPGRLRAEVTYRLTNRLALEIGFRAECDAPTVINLANHAYFNLNSDDSPADNHLVRIRAGHFTPIDRRLIPTGELRPVGGTRFDFRSAAPFAERLGCGDEQLEHAAGYDHNFVLDRSHGRTRLAAELISPQSGLVLRLHTTQPGLQFYTGQHLDRPFVPFAGICLEAQNFPNAPNTASFPSTVLRPGTRYVHTTTYEFFTN